VAHRDYFEKGSNVMVEMFDDRIEITNFGGLPKGLKQEDFGKRSVLRNPNIADLLHRISYIEKMGTGISKIRRLVKEAGLPPVKFEFDTFFTVTFKRLQSKLIIQQDKHTEFGVKFGIKFGIKGKKLERTERILRTLHSGSNISVVGLADIFGVTTRVIEKDIELLKNIGLIKFEGARKTGKYVLTEKGKKLFEEEL
jgi:ATP-dependent DNA helicase RecG